MKVIRCNKCNKEYKGKEFKAIAVEFDLVLSGIYYFCRGCSTITNNYESKKKTKEVLEKKERKKMVIEKSE